MCFCAVDIELCTKQGQCGLVFKYIPVAVTDT